MPIINRPTYIPHKWNYTGIIRYVGNTKILVEDSANPLDNPLRLSHLSELIAEKHLTTDGLPPNYTSNHNLWYTYMSENDDDIYFPPYTDPKILARCIATPPGYAIDSNSMYMYDRNLSQWSRLEVSVEGDNATSSAKFDGYSFDSVVIGTSAAAGLFAVKIIPVS